MADRYRIPATVKTKDDLRKLVPLRGQVNRRDFQHGSDVYCTGSLVFVGFEGAIDGKGQYVGSYVFRDIQPSDSERDMFDFNELVSTASKPKRAAKAFRPRPFTPSPPLAKQDRE